MNAIDRLLPRSLPMSKPQHGPDCVVRFVRSDDNRSAWVDVWEVTMQGRMFCLRLMRMLRRREIDPFVFGSIQDLETGLDIWQFRTDERHLFGFHGDVQTAVSADGQTTEVVYTTYGKEKHRVPFADLLGLTQKPQPVAVPVVTPVPSARPRIRVVDFRPVPKTVIVLDQESWFAQNVLSAMCVSSFTKTA